MLEIIYLLVMTHITILCVTLYLHRSQTHRAVEFHPVVAHFMRFWLWLTTGMITKQWVAVHRLHHQKTDQEGDPHSPQVFGIWRVLFGGAFLYARSARARNNINSYGAGTPDDWIEQQIYTPLNFLGIFILLVINLILFDKIGAVIWLAQMLWIPFWAAGVVNGIGHWWGYRNHDTQDHSRNIMPVGIIIGGEEFHNNHHADPANPKLSHRAWEFDIGWMWIRVLRRLGLARTR